jgi:N-formylglutamate amidohydrolase
VGPLFSLEEGEGPIVATAIHAGHALRSEIAALMALDEATRLREEDPFTGQLARVAPTRLIALRSRFEVDLNRSRERAVYRMPADAWGLKMWRRPLPDDAVARSLTEFDAFYAALKGVLSERAQRHGRFVVLDIHSYNHRREGLAGPAADPRRNPEINVGTGTVDRSRCSHLIDRFCAELSDGRLDVRENVKFQGGALPAWVHRSFPSTGCALALEFKKTFMDEWSGRVDDGQLAVLRGALANTLPGLIESLSA